ncbi:hypothetical protein GDO86_012852 [Hymenochirus boettgeri]|uniref:Uncharacterized protein n=1 Tax=Hymenochirus boettgeri TaxID=247094 RepID=A0A8T2IUD0_9PIPI|nr:hypothetical protein GDO86_012852 [Hymenochirus boettgeri]
MGGKVEHLKKNHAGAWGLPNRPLEHPVGGTSQEYPAIVPRRATWYMKRRIEAPTTTLFVKRLIARTMYVMLFTHKFFNVNVLLMLCREKKKNLYCMVIYND